MPTIDKTRILVDSDIDSIMDDWFERDGETFTKIRKTGRLGWEKTLKEEEPYSAYLLEAPTQEDLIKRAYSLATDMIVVMDLPFKVKVKISTKSDSFTDGKKVFVSTKVFDDKELSVGAKLDVFLGLTIHEGCHCLYTEFPKVSAMDLNRVEQTLFNIIEDERIEEILGDEKPGLANFLEKSKYYFFDQYYLDYVVDKEEAMSPFQRIMNCFLHIIRYPKYLKEKEAIEFGHYLLEVKKVVLPMPKDSVATAKAAKEIFEIIKDFYIDEEKRKEEEKFSASEESEGEEGDGEMTSPGSGTGERKSKSSKGDDTEDEEESDDLEEESDEESYGRGDDDDSESLDDEEESESGDGDDSEESSDSGDGESEKESRRSDEEIVRDAMRKLAEDAEKSISAMKELSRGWKPASTEDEADAVKKRGELLGEICEGGVELGSSRDSYFSKEVNYEMRYKDSYNRVRKFIPAIAKILKGHCREYKLIHKSMRSGVLDTTKLAEAYQGVPTVYLREGEVKTDKVSVCVLIDESGSMGGSRITSARDAAVLINEAVGSVPNVELFIYGHSGDMRYSGATELFVYRENGYAPKYALGSCSARRENRDGLAILETAKRVRKQTKNPVLMFILSDGAPCASGYGGASAMEHVRQCVHQVEQMDFHVIQVCINHCYDPAKMFKNFVVLEDMSTLAFELAKAIKKVTMQKVKSRVI